MDIMSSNSNEIVFTYFLGVEKVRTHPAVRLSESDIKEMIIRDFVLTSYKAPYPRWNQHCGYHYVGLAAPQAALALEVLESYMSFCIF